MATMSKASPSLLHRNTIESLAERLSSAIGYSERKDIGDTIRRLGGRIETKDYWDDDAVTGSLFVQDTEFVIYVPVHTTLDRDRFTIAHELGHYIIHYLYKRRGDPSLTSLIADRYGNDRTEWEANWFAAAFLMPEIEFENTYSQYAGNIQLISQHFGVSEEAARVRAQTLGIDDGNTSTASADRSTALPATDG